jgi:hypothetical protein
MSMLGSASINRRTKAAEWWALRFIRRRGKIL